MESASLAQFRRLAAECAQCGRDDAAVSYAEFACSLSGQDACDVMVLARALRARGEYARAVHRLENAPEEAGLTETTPIGIEARVLLCRCMERQGRWGELLEASQSALQVGGRDEGELLYSQGDTAVELRRLAGFQGSEALTPGQVLGKSTPSARAICSPSSVLASSGSAASSVKAGDAEQEAMHSSDSGSKDTVNKPDKPLGSTESQNDDEDEKLEICRAACASALVLAWALEALARDARHEQTRGTPRSNVAALCHLQGQALGKRGDSEGASAWLRAALAVDPSHVESAQLLAQGHLLEPREASAVAKAAFIAAGIPVHGASREQDQSQVNQEGQDSLEG